jgi:hypothetical protein
MEWTRVIGAGLAVLTLAAEARAQLHEADVVLRVVNGSIETGRIENGTVASPRFVVGSTLGAVVGPNIATDPGFDSATGTFVPQQLVGLTVRRALRAWTGTDFSTLAAETMTVTKGTTSVTTPPIDPASCGTVGDVVLGRANSSGRIHEHPVYVLNAGTGQAAPADGVYLLELQVWLGSSAASVSKPLWIVFNQNADPAAYQAAFAWADANLPQRAGNVCYGNCDGSTVPPTLNAGDFACFLNRFRAQDCYANCDGSTVPPVFNAGDFACFLTRFRAGCP